MTEKRLARSIISIIVRPARFMAGGLGHLILPEACVLCGQALKVTADGTCGVCDCEAPVPKVERFCLRCSAPVGPLLDTTKGCGYCRYDRFAFEKVIAASEYRDIMRDAVLSAKRAGGTATAGWLADTLWKRRSTDLMSLGADLIVPVPQHWSRRLLTPHNSAELIASQLATRLKTRLGRHILIKRRRTPRQAGLIPSARRKNLSSAFVASCPLTQSRVLLVDDVLTTGTTAHRAARALLDAGADRVWVAVAARGIGV